MTSEEDKNRFGIELIKFYKEFLLGSSKAVLQLAKIEQDFPEQYKVIRSLKDDPEAIFEMTTKLPSEVKDTLILVIVKSSAIGRKMNQLFDLNVEQKKELASEIEKFSTDVENKLGGLVAK